VELFKVFIESLLSFCFNNFSTVMFIIIIWIVVFLLKIYYPRFRGFMGEFWVKRELETLPKAYYTILNDIMIRDEAGTHQIDHIVLSNYGIFVIEMKNYYGLIKGDEYSDKWVQYLGRKKNYFMNPIHQNYGHVKSLAKLLNIDESYFIPIVCFSNQVKLRVRFNKNIVTQLDLLVKEILKYDKVICYMDREKIKGSILRYDIVDKKERKLHIDRIRSKVQRESSLSDAMICPKCGGSLVERSGKYGKFIGCSNFPKCHYIKNRQ